jgi:glycosyltransferase involved in cell wall biosynthesis
MAVVVPVRNEERLLARTLTALTAAVDVAEAARLRCEVRIVLDACTDASGEIAAGFAFPIIECSAVRVGAARRLGVAAALDALADVDGARIWIANTDADSRVSSHWLTRQRAIAEVADVYTGTVRPDLDELPAFQQRHWLSTHAPGRQNENVHGANLGLRARTYLDAGGFAELGEHEDVDLVARCRALGAVIVGDDSAEVVTSGRYVGRTPGGYAEFLRRQASDLFDDAAGETTRSVGSSG